MADYLAENQCPKCGKKLNTGFKCEVCDTMADKEERIFVFTTKKYTIKETNEDGVIVDGFIEPRDKAKMYTRQEAIEVMADALIEFKYLNTASADDIEECKRHAEACLNALLKERK